MSLDQMIAAVADLNARVDALLRQVELLAAANAELVRKVQYLLNRAGG